MAFEMICGQCRGNLLVEQFGVVVACPHCGAHLHVPAPEAPAPVAPPPALVPQIAPPTPEPPSPPEPVAVVQPPAPEPTPPESVSESAPSTEEMRAFTGDESEPPPSVEISVMPSIAVTDSITASESVTEEAPAPATGEGGFSLSALMSSSEPATPEPTPEAVEPTASPVEPAAVAAELPESLAATESVTETTSEPLAVTPVETASTGLSGLFGAEATSPPPETATTGQPPVEPIDASDASPTELLSSVESPPTDEHSSVMDSESAVLPAAAATKSVDRDHVTISKSVLLILFSYASAITIGFLYLLYIGSTRPGSYGLESLPDPVPPKRKTSGVYQETAPMPDGHDLKIGDRQRFGNIEVTVLKVTRGPIQFRHFSDAGKARLPSAPVLKLWLRFKNVSEDQEIAPLDDHLLFHRIGRDRLTYHSNQFVVRAEQKNNPDAKRVIAYDHIIGSGWDLADLPLDKPLQPGESRDYYVPTCENDLEALTGELLWRVHIRKGYSARGNGVTTLFEVRFNSDAVTDETA